MLVVCLALCSCRDKVPVEDATKSHPPVESPADGWIGVWQGPEGTSLDLGKVNGGYRITIRNLDGPRTFEGMVSGNGISFTRDGIQESIHAGTGVDTGMKWLAEKSNCLIVKLGEGYCR